MNAAGDQKMPFTEYMVRLRHSPFSVSHPNMTHTHRCRQRKEDARIRRNELGREANYK